MLSTDQLKQNIFPVALQKQFNKTFYNIVKFDERGRKFPVVEASIIAELFPGQEQSKHELFVSLETYRKIFDKRQFILDRRIAEQTPRYRMFLGDIYIAYEFIDNWLEQDKKVRFSDYLRNHRKESLKEQLDEFTTLVSMWCYEVKNGVIDENDDKRESEILSIIDLRYYLLL